jgi:methylmalonyl-CoA mutase cobalamin-binding subunit
MALQEARQPHPFKQRNMMDKKIVVTTLGRDPHTQGIYSFSRVARAAGFDVVSLPPDSTEDDILKTIQKEDPQFVGLSYRLSPDEGLRHVSSLMGRLYENGQLQTFGGESRDIAFAGLPATVDAVTRTFSDHKITGIAQGTDKIKPLIDVLDYLRVEGTKRDKIIHREQERLFPPSIEGLDELAAEVAKDWTPEPPLNKPSEEARQSLVLRINEIWPGRPYILTHFGRPGESIQPTIEGIEEIADARAVDRICLGSSDLSQRHFGRPELWTGKTNDGGVPYKTVADLVALKAATNRGNFPSLESYTHIVDMVNFAEQAVGAGIFLGAHAAVPLYFFNQLDGRGDVPVDEALEEHFAALRAYTEKGIPVEMNDPNHWCSRWAPDAVVVADFGLTTASMLASGVKEMVFQMQFNKPRETSDYGDLAKFSASMEIARRIAPKSTGANMWRMSRTGVEYFEPDLETARKQLARSTLLQMMLNPQIISQVNYCEALHIATTDDVVKSSEVLRKAVRTYQTHQHDLARHINDPTVIERKEHLVNEATFLLDQIARLNPKYEMVGPAGLYQFLADPQTLYRAMQEGIMAAPGIFAEPFRDIAAQTHTDVVAGGYVDSVDPNTGASITQKQRLSHPTR